MNKDYRPINEHLDNLINNAIWKLENKYDHCFERNISVSSADDLLLQALGALHEKVSCLQEQIETQQQHSTHETIMYRGIEIKLWQKLDRNSITGEEPLVWVWQTTGGKLQHKDKTEAIISAKKFIDWRILDPEMKEIF